MVGGSTSTPLRAILKIRFTHLYPKMKRWLQERYLHVLPAPFRAFSIIVLPKKVKKCYTFVTAGGVNDENDTLVALFRLYADRRCRYRRGSGDTGGTRGAGRCCCDRGEEAVCQHRSARPGKGKGPRRRGGRLPEQEAGCVQQ